MKKILITSTIFLALVATVVAAFSLTGRAYAQSPTPTAAAQTAPPKDGTQNSEGGRHGGNGGPMDGGQLRPYVLAAEAEAFGLTTDELQALHDQGKSLNDLAIEQNLTVAEFDARLDTAHQNAIAQAVTDGVLTQEQADAFAARKDASRPDQPRHNFEDNPLFDYMQAAKAEAFGLTVEELTTLQADGKTLKDVAIEQNLTVADFQSKLQAAHQAALDKAVADGVITQEQADAMQNHIEMGPEGGMGHHGRSRGHGNGPDGNCPAAPDDTTTLPES